MSRDAGCGRRTGARHQRRLAGRQPHDIDRPREVGRARVIGRHARPARAAGGCVRRRRPPARRRRPTPRAPPRARRREVPRRRRRRGAPCSRRRRGDPSCARSRQPRAMRRRDRSGLALRSRHGLPDGDAAMRRHSPGHGQPAARKRNWPKTKRAEKETGRKRNGPKTKRPENETGRPEGRPVDRQSYALRTAGSPERKRRCRSVRRHS
ncbi:MAG: hypothetical protein JWL84_2997 [Rhodospirillales bacterium]|nr:hypothetical protein [Rhodospirillales bacterium]